MGIAKSKGDQKSPRNNAVTISGGRNLRDGVAIRKIASREGRLNRFAVGMRIIQK
jgi:hypothetical protein